jgi:hypothetical protein
MDVCLLCEIKKPRERGGHSPRWAAEPVNKNTYIHACIHTYITLIFNALCQFWEQWPVIEKTSMTFRFELKVHGQYCDDTGRRILLIIWPTWSWTLYPYILWWKVRTDRHWDDVQCVLYCTTIQKFTPYKPYTWKDEVDET